MALITVKINGKMARIDGDRHIFTVILTDGWGSINFSRYKAQVFMEFVVTLLQNVFMTSAPGSGVAGPKH